MWPPSRSLTTMLLIRSLMSDTGNDRSTRASPSTAPSLWKYPTPAAHGTTCPIGNCAARAPGSSSPLPAGRALSPGTPTSATAAAAAAAHAPAIIHFLMALSPFDVEDLFVF